MIKKLTFLLVAFCVGISFGQNIGISLEINEIDVDQTSSDTMEFVELKSQPNVSLNGYVLVFFNGGDDESYRTVDLESVTTDDEGFAIIGGTMVPDADVTIGTTNSIQNGPDAVAVYFADAGDFPNGTPATVTNLIDVIVYGTGDADDDGLLAVFGGIQWDEDENGMKDTQSLQKDANTDVFCTATPTLRAENADCNTSCSFNIFTGSISCDSVTEGIDTYTTVLNFTGGGTETYSISSTEGMIFGDNPSTIETGQIIISGVDEGVDFQYTITSQNCAITNFINGASCVPINEVANIAQLRASSLNTLYTLTGEAVITYLQNFRNQKFIQDDTAAILIDDIFGNITTNYNIGDGITGVSGVLTQVEGMLQFQVDADPGAATSTNNIVEAQLITVAQLNANANDYESELVALEIGFIDTTQNDVWVVGTEYLMTENITNAPYIFRTSFFDADYIDEQIDPQGLVAGIITEQNNGDYFITARSTADFSTLSIGAEQEIKGFSMSPNPATTRVTFNGSQSNIFDVVVYDVVGKIILQAKATQTLTVSNLTSGVYFIKASQQGVSTIAKLIVK